MSPLSFCRARRGALLALSAAVLALASPAGAESPAATGAATIRIGNLMPYSGPASAYSIVGRIEQAYFKMINDQGGINGRPIEFISYDDG